MDDVFYCRLEDLVHLPDNPREVVALGRERRALYESQQVPDRWIGEVQPTEASVVSKASEFKGTGVVVGRARVVLGSPDSDTMDEGEIVVCRATGPSWAAYFFVAGGVVIDIGGALSHGAILARESACRVSSIPVPRPAISRPGDLLRVDGDSGSIVVLELVQTAAPSST